MMNDDDDKDDPPYWTGQLGSMILALPSDDGSDVETASG